MIEHLNHFTILGIGIIITSNAATTSAYFLSVAILQALAGGTIIYVVVFEVLERERSKNVSGLTQLFFVILGFCVLMAVELLGKYQLQVFQQKIELCPFLHPLTTNNYTP